MKKKHRNITIDGIKYGWTVYEAVYDGYVLQIWLEKKIIYKENVGYITITPSFVAEVIKKLNII